MGRPAREPPIESSITPLAVRYARARGMDVEALALRFDLPPAVVEAEVVTVAADVPNDLLQAIAVGAGEADVAIRVASQLTGRRHKLVDLAVRGSADVRAALGLLARWAPLLHEGFEASLDPRGGDGGAAWVLRTPRRPRGLGRYVQELAVAHALLELGGAAPLASPSRVWFAHARPPDIERLAALAGGAELAFGAEDSGLLFQEEALALPLRGADHRAVEALAPLIDAELSTTKRATLGARAAAWIASALPQGTEIAEVAARMHMSPRTLQRRLEDEGTRFTDVLDRARLDVARTLLADRDVTLLDVALRLGFSDLATFSRAFKRWTGKPPGQWRRS